MQDTSLARKAGIVGMFGAVLWTISVIIQYGLGVAGPESGSLWIVHEAIAMIALICVVIGFLGLNWGGAVHSRFGKASVYLLAIAWLLIVVAGVAGMLLQTQDSPVFIVYPIGGLLADVGALLTGIAVITAKRWSGWQRFVPLVSALVMVFGLSLPAILGVTDGPGMIGEFVMSVCWFGIALAVYTAQPRTVSAEPSPVAS